MRWDLALSCYTRESLRRLYLENAGRLDGKKRGAKVAFESGDAVAEDAPAAERHREEIPDDRVDSPFDIEGFLVAGEILETRTRDVRLVTLLGRRTRIFPGQEPLAEIALQHRVNCGAPARHGRRRNRSTFPHHREASTGRHEIVQRVERSRAIHPVKRVAHCYQAELSECGRQVFRAAESPLDIGDAAFARDALALRTHRVIGIHRNDFFEAMRQRNRDRTGAATEIQQPARAVAA